MGLHYIFQNDSSTRFLHLAVRLNGSLFTNDGDIMWTFGAEMENEVYIVVMINGRLKGKQVQLKWKI